MGVASGAWAGPKIFNAVARPEHPPTDISRNATARGLRFVLNMKRKPRNFLMCMESDRALAKRCTVLHIRIQPLSVLLTLHIWQYGHSHLQNIIHIVEHLLSIYGL